MVAPLKSKKESRIKPERMDHLEKGAVFGKLIKRSKLKSEDRNRRLRQAYVVIGLVTIAYYTDRFIGTYTGAWKIYAYIVGTVFAIGAGYLTVTHVLDRLIDKKK